MMFLEDMVVDVAHFQSLKLVTDFYEYITINNSYLPPYCCGDWLNIDDGICPPDCGADG